MSKRVFPPKLIHAILAYPLAHWRGEVGLWPTLTLTLLGVRLLISALGGIPYLTFDVILLIWQLTGALRAIIKAQTNRPDLLSAIAGYSAVFLCLPLMILPHFDRNAARFRDVSPPEATVETGLHLVATYAILEGPISFTMFSALKTALEQNPKLGRLVLSSQGGRVFAARAIARLVGEYGLHTEVMDTCASACSLIFIAGKSRSLSPGARLGFHGYRYASYVRIVDPAEEEAKDRDAFLAQGLSADFVVRVFKAAPQDMWFPTRPELLAAGVLTEP